MIPLLLLALLLTACSGQTAESSTQSPGPEPTQSTPSASTGSGLVAAEEPGLLRRWHYEDDFPAKCVTCNACFRPILTGRGFYCPRERSSDCSK